jgi:hypothetical protein
MKKIPTLKQAEKFIKPVWDKKDPMHNWKHYLRMKRKAAFLKKQYKNIDNELLNFLICFHGSWARKNKEKVIALGYPASWLNKIDKPVTPEGKIVWDANCLENVGKFGIKKSLDLERYYGQTRKQTLDIVKEFSKKYKLYTPLGKKLGSKGIKLKLKWMDDELKKLGDKR